MDDLDQPEPERQESPTPPPSSPAFDPAEMQKALERMAALYEQNIRLQVQRNDQLANKLADLFGELSAVMDEMRTTIQLQQEMLGQQDTVIQNLGKATAALIHLRADFQAQVEEIRAAQRQ